ncbi:hypothetical protein [Knoellia sp. LjRoot47]|uniref:hypothetical protein n=1 Tax=Knoellia sp. LjRoot47 TaxID=3342330 RepID=UPI003ECCA06F
MSESLHSPQVQVAVIVRNAERVVAELDRDDVLMAHGYALTLISQATELANDLELKVRQLPPAEHERANPYRHVPLHGVTTQEAVARLTTEDLLTSCRYTNWTHEHRANPMARWWVSKHMSILVLELKRRGLDEDAWRDGPRSE